jgi:hypothetical protein
VFEITVRGHERVIRNLVRLAVASPRAAQQGLRTEAEIEMTEMKQRTPVKTGALRGSGRIEDLPNNGGVRFLFGGPAVDYAVPVHENLDVFHPTGQAKFMESVLNESVQHIPARVAARMRILLGIR